MDTPLPPADVVRVLDGMSFFGKRALKKAGFRWDGLRRLAGTEYGAGLVEAVLACHTELLGRPARADEPDKAGAARRHPGVPAPVSPSYTPRYSRPSAQDREAFEEAAALADARKKAREQGRGRG